MPILGGDGWICSFLLKKLNNTGKTHCILSLSECDNPDFIFQSDVQEDQLSFPARVLCLCYSRGKLYVGLTDGTISVVNPSVCAFLLFQIFAWLRKSFLWIRNYFKYVKIRVLFFYLRQWKKWIKYMVASKVLDAYGREKKELGIYFWWHLSMALYLSGIFDQDYLFGR